MKEKVKNSFLAKKTLLLFTCFSNESSFVNHWTNHFIKRNVAVALKMMFMLILKISSEINCTRPEEEHNNG